MIIDFHTHIFPDRIAARAVAGLAEAGGVRAHTDGTAAALLRSMDLSGIQASVACMIATRPEQTASIHAWCKEIRSERIIPLPSVHPRDPECLNHLRAIHKDGFKGIKLHPYYQEFSLLDPVMVPLYEAISDLGLILLMHTGFDIAFPRTRLADPAAIATVCRRYPDLLFVASHLGAWQLWDEVEEHLVGRPIYLDTSFALADAGPERARRIIEGHPQEFILFGSDSPWEDQGAAVANLTALELSPERTAAILGANARRLLDSV